MIWYRDEREPNKSPMFQRMMASGMNVDGWMNFGVWSDGGVTAVMRA